jgi:hypothetical protein
LPNPCQFNGVCIPSGTTGYVCVCPANFTGPQCNLVTNPCLYSPCKYFLFESFKNKPRILKKYFRFK